MKLQRKLVSSVEKGASIMLMDCHSNDATKVTNHLHRFLSYFSCCRKKDVFITKENDMHRGSHRTLSILKFDYFKSSDVLNFVFTSE